MNSTPRFCNRCGASLSPAAKFCPQCGAPVDAPEPILNPQIFPPIVQPTAVSPTGFLPAETKRGNPPLILIVGGLATILVLGCCVALGMILLYSNLIEESSEAPSPTTGESQPVPSETSESESTITSLNSVNYAGIRFSYDPSLASGISSETIPAQNDPAGATWELVPEHVTFSFTGYPLFPGAQLEPKIYVYPVVPFIALNPDVAETVADLQDLLDRKPATLGPDETIPYLPIINAAQLMQAGIHYLDFQNGRGVRFLTMYGQDVYPIHNGAMFYSFQGLTQDNRYYLEAMLPVSNPILPDPDSVVIEDDFYSNFPTYIQDIEQQLSAQPPHTFIPDLTLLDSLMQSFRIDR